MDGRQDPESLMARARQAAGEHIEAMTATVEVYGMMSFQYAGQDIIKTITLIGIDPAGKAKVGPLRDSLESFKPVVEDGIVVRPALRDAGSIPNWELTDEAIEYRQAWMERQEAFLRHWQQEDDTNPASDVFDNPFNQPLSPPANSLSDANAGPSSPIEQPATNAQSVPPAVLADGESAGPTDPFQYPHDQPAFMDEVDGYDEDVSESINPYASLPIRLYVGSGLIEFP